METDGASPAATENVQPVGSLKLMTGLLALHQELLSVSRGLPRNALSPWCAVAIERCGFVRGLVRITKDQALTFISDGDIKTCLRQSTPSGPSRLDIC